jgi:hypothetical protein
MRQKATQNLAWHLVFVERLAELRVVEELVEWVYRTGRETSTDVMSGAALASPV